MHSSNYGRVMCHPCGASYTSYPPLSIYHSKDTPDTSWNTDMIVKSWAHTLMRMPLMIDGLISDMYKQWLPRILTLKSLAFHKCSSSI